MPISEELKRVYASAPNDDYYIETLSLEHPTFENGVRYLTNQNGGWIGKLETGGRAAYQYVPFVSLPPSAEDQAAITLNIVIDNASRELMYELENMAQTPSQPITVVYRVYLSSGQETLQNDPPIRLWVSNVVADQRSVSFAATTTNLRNTPFPSKLYNTDLFTGLKR
jgi:hypothetical protein